MPPFLFITNQYFSLSISRVVISILSILFIFTLNSKDGSFSILIWVTLFETLKNPPFLPFSKGEFRFPL